ncbi:MAG: bifunctional phosphopantothenoylcysteine decarboxylase/phosphopantothenate--cysteine ligase CoaBC [Saprospiraceae bacterium]|nr:bifunctional phosphopantothenoylcysteine decarboxylase/phosphopantothenate--cysteine ligase CoaBC [Saprospiraceae bacterium]
MSSALSGKKIILSITGSIAAYKAASLCRLFIKAGAEVKVVMTKAACDFISPLTLSTLSQHPVQTSVSSEEGWNNHVELGLWADAMVLAPLTATSLGKLANGIADNMVAAVYLSARCPVFFAPAMDVDMWHHPSTQGNVQQLQSYGNHLIPVGHGELASGLVGAGRMAEPEAIVDHLADFFAAQQSLAGKHVIITAGPTYEPIDPVRFIGNRSSGKMGMALAEEASSRGAKVTLILGPSALSTTDTRVDIQRVGTAQEMFEAAKAAYGSADVAILAAAVADYRPATVAEHKIKKNADTYAIELVKTPDIAAELGKLKTKDQINIGFALETQDGPTNAEAKLEKKNFDFIVLNSLQDPGAGFQHDTNKITILHAKSTPSKGNKIKKFELKSKVAVAKDIVDELEAVLTGKE